MLEVAVVNKAPLGLELLVWRWSCDSHTFVTTSGKFTHTLEDVVRITMMPLCGKVNVVGIVMEETIK